MPSNKKNVIPNFNVNTLFTIVLNNANMNNTNTISITSSSSTATSANSTVSTSTTAAPSFALPKNPSLKPNWMLEGEKRAKEREEKTRNKQIPVGYTPLGIGGLKSRGPPAPPLIIPSSNDIDIRKDISPKAISPRGLGNLPPPIIIPTSNIIPAPESIPIESAETFSKTENHQPTHHTTRKAVVWADAIDDKEVKLRNIFTG